MKKLTLIFFGVFMLIASNSFAQTIFEPRGSEIVPGIIHHFVASGDSTITYVVLTNITNESIRVRVKGYDQDGNDISQYCAIQTGSINNGWTLIGLGDMEFDMPPHSTRMWNISGKCPSHYVLGHAVVEWTSEDARLRKALAGTVWAFRHETNMATFPINNGKPF